MKEEQTTTTIDEKVDAVQTEDTAVTSDASSDTALEVEAKPDFQKRRNASRDTLRRNPRRPGRREERVKPEFDQKIVSIRRVTRVVAGGRRMSFAVSLVAGNRKGKVGVGTGKAVDTSLAIEKAFRDAKKKMINVSLTKNNSIPHDIEKKYSASVVMMSPARGRGLVAGGAVRTVLELAGVTDVSAKLLSRSKNHLNNAKATIEGLKMIRTRAK